MRLSQHSDYALRTLMYVALRDPALTTVREIADDFELSMTHLQKVAQTLAAHGYLETVRGRSGGLRLARRADDIRLGRVITISEPDFQLAPCMNEEVHSCRIYEPCVLRNVLAGARDAFVEELNQWTLADLIRPRKPLLVALDGLKLRSQGVSG